MTQMLVVDDSPAIRKIARRIFERLGFQTAEAEDGQRALMMCATTLPDAVLIDWNVPVLDGFNFAREFRKLPGGREPMLILCTTENDVAHLARAMHAGFDTYLMKPFDQSIIEAKFTEFGLLEDGVPAMPVRVQAEAS